MSQVTLQLTLQRLVRPEETVSQLCGRHTEQAGTGHGAASDRIDFADCFRGRQGFAAQAVETVCWRLRGSIRSSADPVGDRDRLRRNDSVRVAR